MKKLTAVLLTALLAVGLIACGSSAPAKENAGEASKAAETEKSAENAAADTKNAAGEAENAAGEAAEALEDAEDAAPEEAQSAAAAALAASKGVVLTLEEKEHTISVSATGTVSIEPDMAKITMGVVTEEATATEAQSKNAETINAVTDKLKELGVAEKSIQTSNYYMYQLYNYDSNTVRGYSVSCSITVSDQKVENVGKVIAACTEAGANQFQGIYMTSSKYDEAYEQALTAAVENARKKAEVIAAAAGCTLGKPVLIDEGYQDTSARYRDANVYMEKPMAEESAADMAVMAGQLSIDAPVTVTYLIED